MSSQDAKPSGVDGLLAELARTGRAVGPGHFTLARDHAREKLREFQLVDPEHYILELIQAATIQGADRVLIDQRDTELRLYYAGRTFELADLDALYESLLSGESSPQIAARRHLAVGLNAALELDPRAIHLLSGDGDGRIEMTLRAGEPDVYERVTEAGDGTLIRIARTADIAALNELLSQRCRYSNVRIEVNGMVVSFGMHLPDVVATVPFDDDGISGLAAFDPTAGPAQMHLLRRGVLVTSHRLTDAPRGFVALVDAPDLRTDLTQSDVIRDEAYRRVEAVVDRAKADARRELERLAAPPVDLFAARSLLGKP